MDHETIEKEILRLIQEADPTLRPVLLLMYQQNMMIGTLAESTKENTEASKLHAQILEQHASDEMALFNQLKGGRKVANFAWAVIGGLLIILQGVGVSLWNRTQDEVRNLTTRTGTLEVDVAKHRAYTEAVHGNGGAK